MLWCAAAVPVHADDLHWTGAAGDGLWSTAGNWSPAQTPGSVHDVYLDADTAATVQIDGFPSVRSLTVGGGAGDVHAAFNTAAIHVEDGMTIADNGRVTGMYYVLGGLTMTGGTLTPKTAQWTNVETDFTMTGGTLEVRVDANGVNGGVLVFGDHASIAGTLRLVVEGAVLPGKLGVVIADDPGVTVQGAFETLDIPVVDGLTYALVQEANRVELFRFGLLAGDANNDGVVDAADLLAVEQHFGATGVTNGSLLGDANDDGRVDGADWLAVERRFGAVWESPASVPEPAGGGGVAMGVMIALAVGRRRRASKLAR